MIKLTAHQFLGLLDQAQALYVGDSPLVDNISIALACGVPENEVIFVSWESEGNTFSIKITEEGLNDVTEIAREAPLL